MPFTPIQAGDTGLSVREKLNTGLALADTAVQPDDLGTAAATDAAAYATAAQGALADSAVQPPAISAVTITAGAIATPLDGNHRTAAHRGCLCRLDCAAALRRRCGDAGVLGISRHPSPRIRRAVCVVDSR